MIFYTQAKSYYEHKTVPMTLGLVTVDIDHKMINIIKHLWDYGMPTEACCQGNPMLEKRFQDSKARLRRINGLTSYSAAYILFYQASDASLFADFLSTIKYPRYIPRTQEEVNGKIVRFSCRNLWYVEKHLNQLVKDNG